MPSIFFSIQCVEHRDNQRNLPLSLCLMGDRYFRLIFLSHWLKEVHYNNNITKWVEVEPFATITNQKMTDFIWKCIMCKFGIPKVIRADNRK